MKDLTHICTACPDYPSCNPDRERVYQALENYFQPPQLFLMFLKLFLDSWIKIIMLGLLSSQAWFNAAPFWLNKIQYIQPLQIIFL